MKILTAATLLKQTLICLPLIAFASKIKAQVNSFEIDSSKFKVALLPILDSIYKNDQTYRLELGELTKTKAGKSQVDSVRRIIREKDSINIIKVSEILNTYGWLGPQDVGMNGSQGIFLVIQHADLATQKKYFPLVKQAEKDGKTLSSNLALLEDRIAMREGRKQIYGSQFFKDKISGLNHIYPVIDVDNLDKRRKAMGMPPMSTYVVNWNLEEYKNKLSELENIVKQQNIR